MESSHFKLAESSFLFSIPTLMLLVCSCTQTSLDSNESLNTFPQSITSTVTSLNLKPGQQIAVPVVITNTGKSAWSPKGLHPVTLSYRWIRNDEILPIEGQRTFLQHVLKPGDSLSTESLVIAPPTPGQFSLGFSMVQEGITWFALAPGGGGWFTIPVRVQ